jgi:hypothetical protein
MWQDYFIQNMFVALTMQWVTTHGAGFGITQLPM